jgi:hypothetical protein
MRSREAVRGSLAQRGARGPPAQRAELARTAGARCGHVDVLRGRNVPAQGQLRGLDLFGKHEASDRLTVVNRSTSSAHRRQGTGVSTTGTPDNRCQLRTEGSLRVGPAASFGRKLSSGRVTVSG